MLTGSEGKVVVEAFGVPITGISKGDDVNGLSKIIFVTWRISFIASITSVVRGRSRNLISDQTKYKLDRKTYSYMLHDVDE
jgi:hypothetical protein